ncbi:transposase [Methylobacterium sp. E-041]|uniref:transposase n=1 Tax=Methylobacterium sp. E-041 TaxID=2836573 RepID=UPI003918C741
MRDMPDLRELFWLNDIQWSVVSTYLPADKQPRLDDRHTLSGIIYVSLSGCRWTDCPKLYGSHSTIYQRFRRWRHRPFWTLMLLAMAKEGWHEEARALDPLAITLVRSTRGRKPDRAWRHARIRSLANRTNDKAHSNNK